MSIAQASNLFEFGIPCTDLYGIVALAFVYTQYLCNQASSRQDTLTNRKTLRDVSGARSAAFLMGMVAIVPIHGCFSMFPMERWNFSLPGFNSQMVC